VARETKNSVVPNSNRPVIAHSPKIVQAKLLLSLVGWSFPINFDVLFSNKGRVNTDLGETYIKLYKKDWTICKVTTI